MWTVVQHTKSTPLPTEESARPQPFIIRLQVLDSLFDIPSSCLKLDQETLELVTLSCRSLQEQEEGGLKAAAKAVQRGAEAGIRGLQVKRIVQYAGGARPDELSEKEPKERVRRSTSISITRKLSALAKGRKWIGRGSQDVRGTWKPHVFPRKRDLIKILVRTSQRVTHGDRAIFDLFLTSTMVVRNNTSLGLQLFPTIPGPLDKEPIDSFLGVYHAAPPDPNLEIPVAARSLERALRSKQKGGALKLGVLHRFTQEEIEQQRRDVIAPHIREVKGKFNSNKTTPVKEDTLPDLWGAAERQEGGSEPFDEAPFRSTLGFQPVHPEKDLIKMEPFDARAIPIPLYWLACMNAALWVTGTDEKFFIRKDMRDLTEDYEKSDLLLTVRQRVAKERSLILVMNLMYSSWRTVLKREMNHDYCYYRINQSGSGLTFFLAGLSGC